MKRKLRWIAILCLVLIGCLTIPVFLPPETGLINVAEAASVKLNKSKATMDIGDTLELKVKGTKDKVTWSSSNKKIVAVDKTGKVKAKDAGKATITAKVNGKKYKCTVTVREPKLNKKKLTLYVDEFSYIDLDHAKGKVSWSSSDKNIASVDKYGIVTGKKVGTATITAKFNGKQYKCSVTVNSNFSASSNNVTITSGSSQAVTITYRGHNTIRFDSGDTTIAQCKWGDFSNHTVPLYIYGYEVGTTTVTVTDKVTGDSISIKVTVEPNYLEGDIQILYGKTIEEANKMLEDDFKLSDNGDNTYTSGIGWFFVHVNSNGQIYRIYTDYGTKYSLFGAKRDMNYLLAADAITSFENYGWELSYSDASGMMFESTKFPSLQVIMHFNKTTLKVTYVSFGNRLT